MKKEVNYGKIFCYLLIATFISLALFCITLHFVYFGFSVDGIISAVIIIIICIILTAIFSLSARGTIKVKRKNNLSRFRKRMESEIEDEIANKSNSKKEKIKNLLLGLTIFIVCGIGYIPLFILGSNSLKKINSDNYTKTTATIKFVIDDGEGMSRLAYTYTAEDGNIYRSNTNVSFGGVAFKEGKTVTIYYDNSSPDVIISTSNIILTFMGGAFFFLGGLFAFLGMSVIGRSSIFAIAFGIIFLMFSVCMIAGIELASGLSFLELIGSGLSVYAMLCFLIIGLLLTGIGISETIKNINFAIYKHKNPDEVQKFEARIEKKAQLKLKENENELIIEQKVKEKGKNRKKYHHKFSKDLIGLSIAAAVFLGVGLWLFVGLGILPTSKYYSYSKVEATVTKIETYKSKKDGNVLATYFYEYSVDGKKYEKESSYGQSAELVPIVGSKINIRINPKNPEDVLDGSFIGWTMIGIGLLCTSVGTGICIGMWFMSRTSVKETKTE